MSETRRRTIGSNHTSTHFTFLGEEPKYRWLSEGNEEGEGRVLCEWNWPAPWVPAGRLFTPLYYPIGRDESSPDPFLRHGSPKVSPHVVGHLQTLPYPNTSGNLAL